MEMDQHCPPATGGGVQQVAGSPRRQAVDVGARRAGRGESVDLTRWLNCPDRDPDQECFDALYRDLKRIARSRMQSERAGHTLSATALVHEAWLRLERGGRSERWRDRSHYYAAASEAMRRILVEAARRRLAAKRGGGEAPLVLEEADLSSPLPDDQLVAVHELLEHLEAEDETNAQIVKLRFFAGMTTDEIAVLLGCTRKTVSRRWTIAKVWLYRALQVGA